MNKLLIPFLSLSFLAGGCDAAPPPTITTPSTDSPPAPPSKDVFEHVTKTDRFADFTSVIDCQWKSPDGRTDWKYIDKITLTLTPTRTGAYLIEGWQKSYKLISLPNENIGEKAFEFVLVFQQINVTFSDGKSIERTVIDVPLNKP
jgi:hypothetical protein